jgi:hypothetical protein
VHLESIAAAARLHRARVTRKRFEVRKEARNRGAQKAQEKRTGRVRERWELSGARVDGVKRLIRIDESAGAGLGNALHKRRKSLIDAVILEPRRFQLGLYKEPLVGR